MRLALMLPENILRISRHGFDINGEQQFVILDLENHFLEYCTQEVLDLGPFAG